MENKLKKDLLLLKRGLMDVAREQGSTKQEL